MIKTYKPFFNIGPGFFVKGELKARNWQKTYFAKITELSLESINNLLTNKQAITTAIAHRLSKAFGQSPGFWLNLEENYRKRLKTKGGANVK